MHQLLADKKLVPKLLHLDKIVGGWFADVMDFIEGIHIDTETAAMNDHVKKQLGQTLEVLKSHKFVHSDLQTPNVLLISTFTV